MSDIKTYNADWLLTQWVRWNRYGEGSGTLLGSLVGGGLPSPVISDDEALAINTILGEMLARMPERANATLIFYNSDRNYSAVADRMEISRTRATSLVNEGVAWVDGKIDDCRDLSRVVAVFGCLRSGKRAPEADETTADIARYLSEIS